MGYSSCGQFLLVIVYTCIFITNFFEVAVLFCKILVLVFIYFYFLRGWGVSKFSDEPAHPSSLAGALSLHRQECSNAVILKKRITIRIHFRLDFQLSRVYSKPRNYHKIVLTYFHSHAKFRMQRQKWIHIGVSHSYFHFILFYHDEQIMEKPGNVVQ